MKRLLVLLFVCIILFCSCKRTTPVETTDAVVTDDTSVTVIVDTTAPEETIFEDIKVETPTVGPGVDVKYEVLTLDDAELQAILDAESEAMLNKYIPNISSVTSLGGTAEYDVKLESVYKNDTILSAVFSGNYAIYYENRAERSFILLISTL